MNHSWNIKRLGDICTSELGKTRDEKRNKGSFRPYLCAVNVQWDKFELSELKEMRFEDNEYDRYTIRKGDLVICEGGDIGRAAIWDKDEPIHYQNALHRVRFNEGVDSRFILYYLYFLKQTGILDGRYGKGVTIKHLVKSSLLSIPVPVPPIDEQQRIVFELDLLTDIIDKKNAQLRDLNSLIDALFFEMFGEAENNQKGFPVLSVNDVIEFQGGSQPDKKFFEYEPTDNNVRLIQIRDYKTDRYITYVPKALARRFCTENDIMIGRYGPPIFQILKGISGAYNVALMKAIPKKGNIDFVRVFLRQKKLLHYLESFSRRVAGQDGIQMDKLKAYPFPYPPEALQNSFARQYLDIEEQKKRIQSSLEEANLLLNSRMDYCFRQ